tara:strand:+ start:344 stop:961 length:618 start_codon:yes stop_codon:yes gene_type:complete
MTGKKFIDKVINHKDKANELIEGDGGFNIKRGMAHTISGYVEDLFALFIATNVNCKENEYLVDKVISIRFNENEKAKSFKPDLAIVNNNLLTHYFDLKTNMGWNRHFDIYLKEKNAFIEKLKNRNAWIRHNKKEVQEINISEDLTYQMVVVFGWNINKDLLQNNLEIAKNYPNVKVNILYAHDDESNEYSVNEKAFNSILKSVIA